MNGRAGLSGAGIAGLTLGLIIGGAITYGLATAIPIGKPYTITETVTSMVTSASPAAGKVAYVSLLRGAGDNKSSAGYSPATVVVVIGVNNTVVWANNDAVPHTVTPASVPDGAGWSGGSGILSPGQAYSHTFTVEGTHTYGCAYHSWMQGRIVVKNSSGS